MSTSYRRRILAGAGALTLALTGGVVGLAGTAAAATTTTPVFSVCDAPAPQPDGSGNQNYTITLPDTAKAGDVVPITIDPGASPLVPSFSVTTVNTTKITLKVGSTTQTVVSPPETVTVVAGVPLDPKAFSGTITVPDGTEGTRVNLLLDQAVTDADLSGSIFTTTCVPQPRPSASIGSIQVEALPKDPVTTKLTPNSGGPDTAVVATGANFPAGPVTCKALLSGAATGDTGTGSADAAGVATCNITITKKADAVIIDGSVPPAKAFNWIPPAVGVPHPVDIEVLAGPLTLGPTGGLPALDFGAVTINGKKQSVVGQFNAATVQDFRGGTLGWDLTVTRTPFLNTTTGHAMATAQLGIQPVCTVTNPDSPSACTAGTPGAITDTPLKVASAAPGGDELTGGEFAVGGGAMIQLPAFMFADTYQSVVTFSVS
ncbi:WxL domain-containing protein [Streptomyces bambusae]|uniref:WxL domain-containing protein n=1 Tax=Streptomyces bambusae TaxID=1550616 RepID=UPI001CFFD2AA|nr:WxL domain-containing protein [Streptomyces bambusae]MCB5170291.1 WxL domain-containing protein [Streptomyces bambusae]